MLMCRLWRAGEREPTKGQDSQGRLEEVGSRKMDFAQTEPSLCWEQGKEELEELWRLEGGLVGAR